MSAMGLCLMVIVYCVVTETPSYMDNLSDVAFITHPYTILLILAFYAMCYFGGIAQIVVVDQWKRRY